MSGAGAVPRNRPGYVTELTPGAWRLEVWVQPNAKKSEVAGLYQGRLKVKLGAPAVDNKANEALLAFLAGRLGLKPRQVSLLSGHASRQKTLRIESDREPLWAAVDPESALSPTP